MKGFQKIYPFTTESISGYITKMDIKDKMVLTLGSSCDQALNSLLLGAKDVTIFDINEQVKNFYELKRKLILSTSREDLREKLINELNSKDFLYFNEIFLNDSLIKMNLYLQNDENYNKLRNILKEKKINFIVGDIFNVTEYSKLNQKYDRVILSNVLDYLPTDLDKSKKVFDIYKGLSQHLNEGSLIQLYYLYGTLFSNDFIKVVNRFLDYNILFEKIPCDEEDSAIFVKKK